MEILRGTVWAAALLSVVVSNHGGYPQTPSSSAHQPGGALPPDLNAVFLMTVSLIVKPEIPTSYDRTSIALESSPQMNFEVVEIRDETRGIKAKFQGKSASLETMFGPKNGLSDRIVVNALVRIPGQPGEKTVRKTIRLRNVPPEIWHNAERRGRVRIHVQLDSLAEGLGVGRIEDAAARREAITKAQDDLITKLAGTEYKILRAFPSDSGFLLEAGPSALAVLDGLPEVIKIKEEMMGFIQ
jgi:hypothetical protein